MSGNGDRVGTTDAVPVPRLPLTSRAMDRPTRFEHHRFLGDKRTQVVYDLDTFTDAEVIDELMEARTYLCFGPDTLPEARNRGYRLAPGHPAGD